MKLDRSKTYEGLGLTWEYDAAGVWLSQERSCEYSGAHKASALDDQMRAWLDAGHIKPVKETKIVRVEGVEVLFDASSHLVAIALGGGADWSNLPNGSRSLPVTLEFPVEVEA